MTLAALEAPEASPSEYVGVRDWSIERLLWFVDRHAASVVAGDLAPVLAQCAGKWRLALVEEFRSLPSPIDAAVVESVVLRGDGFLVQVRYSASPQVFVLTTYWKADSKGRIWVVGASRDDWPHS